MADGTEAFSARLCAPGIAARRYALLFEIANQGEILGTTPARELAARV